MKEMWDNRYSNKEYAYGTEPNAFFKQTIDNLKIKGNLLLPAEGEGRNAVYAAKKGLTVHAFDISIEGKKKAFQLAEKENVKIDYQVGDFFEMVFTEEHFDAAALVFAHLPPPVLSKYHKKIEALIKTNGYIILEGYSKNNLPLRMANPAIGGPEKIEMLFSTESIKADFPDFEIIQLEEVEVHLTEGLYHNGVSKVIRFVGRKR
jgi:cyclopropane fatty-acyl-phospholipid synthase-like methyltransferase